jgi:hypothetical protein
MTTGIRSFIHVNVFIPIVRVRLGPRGVVGRRQKTYCV